MKRREFLRNSAISAGALMAGAGIVNAEARTQTNATQKSSTHAESDDGAVHARPPEKLMEIPGTTVQIVDGLTTVPVTVTIGKFLISPTEVTQQEYEEIAGENPSFYRGADRPVETVTWWEAIRYCNLRSFKEHLEPCYNLETGFCDIRKNGYRLPSDVEWTRASGTPLDQPDTNRKTANLGNDETTRVQPLMEELKDPGTKPVGSYPANRYGLYDMFGNVWEWCTDYYNPWREPQASYNPAGPLRGLDRIIRGGSFITSTLKWIVHDYRRRCAPDYKSRFTGFRVARTLEPDPVLPPAHDSPDWFQQFNDAPPGYATTIGPLSSLVTGIDSLAGWKVRRKAIKEKWLKLIGSMDLEPLPPKTWLIEEVKHQNYTAKMMGLRTEPDSWEKILVMMPAADIARPRPVVIVPFYDVDTSAARDLSGNEYLGPTVDPYAYCAVQKGYIAVAIRWYGESYGEAENESVANLKLRHPNATGVGKWIWDAHRLVDYLYTLPEVDRNHIGIIGHSLGGKMALHAPAFDERITAVVSNELGIGLTFSNYEDYWYFGDFINHIPPGTDQHELIALIAPRPFLLVGGDMYDTAKSWYYINAARAVYKLYGKPENVGYFNHHKGHSPPPEAIWRMNEWLAHFLGPQA